MKTVTLRTLTLILGLAFFAAQPVQAGTKEINAINSKLPVGKTIATATDAELSAAVIAAMKDPVNSKLNQATIAGEALKGAVTATNIGNVLATDILADIANLPKVSANVQKFTGASSKTAATGTGANPTQIPTWASVFIANVPEAQRNAEAIAIAKFAPGSTTAIGAIIGGRALTGDASIDTDLERVTYANQAIADRKLSSSSQQIAQYVSDTAADVPNFTLSLVALGTNTKFLSKVVTGTTTANPTLASDILDTMFAANNVSSPVFLSTVKNASTLAKNLGKVADIEEVSQMATEFGERIGLINPATGKVVGIKDSKINTIAKSLAVGIATRATAGNQDNRTNRIDEIAEVGAYMMNAIRTLPFFTATSTKANIKKAQNTVTNLIKTLVKASLKVHRDVAQVPPTNPKITTTKDTQFQAHVADDIAGSVAQTIRSIGAGNFGAAGPGLVSIYDAIVAQLTKPTIGKTIAGSSKTLFDVGDGPKPIAQLVQDALASGLNNTNNASVIYEDGFTVANVNDPETDIRNR